MDPVDKKLMWLTIAAVACIVYGMYWFTKVMGA